MTTKQKIYYDGQLLNLAKGFLEAGFTVDNLQTIDTVVFQTPQLQKLLENPGISINQKKNIVDKIFQNSFEGTCIKYLLDQNAVKHLKELFAALEDLLLQQKKILRGTLTYAKSLPDSHQLETIEKQLLSSLDFDSIQWTFIQSEELLDGFSLEVDGKFYDYSLNGKLNKLLNHLNRR